ncbi:MAG TPA: DNA-3-methyladenine glycosylase [Solirubrobacteraceae bacterium]|nr:DNA-3-methyladenine glycosylase [Solirubrobacteraceae bacterium]
MARASAAGAISDGLAHLRAADPVLAALIERYGPDGLGERREGGQREHYGALVRSIVGQQLSTKAAAAIYRRLADRFGGRAPTPAEVLADDPEELRAAVGLSRAKVGFLRSLAEHVLDGSLELEKLDELPDEQVIAELTAVKGIGVWSAHMFLMFHLERPDILAVGDLGIRKSMMLAYGLPALPPPDEMERIAAGWSPYRTLACRYLWRALDNEPA